jgi:hypothetical protein
MVAAALLFPRLFGRLLVAGNERLQLLDRVDLEERINEKAETLQLLRVLVLYQRCGCLI